MRASRASRRSCPPAAASRRFKGHTSGRYRFAFAHAAGLGRQRSRSSVSSKENKFLPPPPLRSARRSSSTIGFQLVTRRQLHERLWGASRRAGLRRIRWHDLRHSFASQLASRSVPLNQVRERLGHSTIAMTMRYLGSDPSGIRKRVSRRETERRFAVSDGESRNGIIEKSRREGER